jgi:ketosteroid isomerase-like protein
MMKTLFVRITPILLAVVLSSCSFKAREKSVRNVLAEQQRSWNQGDLEGFMQGYVPGDSLIFIGEKGIRYGYQATLKGYKKTYTDLKAMGNLDFDILHVLNAGPKAVVVVGKWKLIRDKDMPQGYFSLLFKKVKGQWKIVVDHTS